MCAMTEREQAAHPKCGYFLLTGTGVREGRSRRAYHGAPKGGPVWVRFDPIGFRTLVRLHFSLCSLLMLVLEGGMRTRSVNQGTYLGTYLLLSRSQLEAG